MGDLWWDKTLIIRVKKAASILYFGRLEQGIWRLDTRDQGDQKRDLIQRSTGTGCPHLQAGRVRESQRWKNSKRNNVDWTFMIIDILM